MGAMHSWVWGEMYPDFMDALMPLASAPVEIAGRNRLLRDMIMDAITSDPEYKNGDYDHPIHGLRAAQYGLTMMTSSPLQMLKQYPTRDKADAGFDRADGDGDEEGRQRHAVSVRVVEPTTIRSRISKKSRPG